MAFCKTSLGAHCCFLNLLYVIGARVGGERMKELILYVVGARVGGERVKELVLSRNCVILD